MKPLDVIRTELGYQNDIQPSRKKKLHRALRFPIPFWVDRMKKKPYLHLTERLFVAIAYKETHKKQ